MNFLAHIYLSGDDEMIKIGNFMADGIRGKDYLKFGEGIKTGILLHRQIDTFTDSHAIFRKSKHRLHENYGHYAGVITDIFYDHFLAKNWNKYSEIALNDYVAQFYESLLRNENVLTEKTKQLLPHIIKGNWLLSYSSVKGIENILFQMNNRVKTNVKLQDATKELQLHYSNFEIEFELFFNELINFVNQLQK